MPTNTSLQESRAGKAIAAASGLCMASLTNVKRIRRAVPTNGHHMRGAAQPRLIRLKPGFIAIFPALVRELRLSLLIQRAAVNIESHATPVRRTQCSTFPAPD